MTTPAPRERATPRYEMRRFDFADSDHGEWMAWQECGESDYLHYDGRRGDVQVRLAPQRRTPDDPLSALLHEALDLVPRMSDDDPIAPALADWCARVRAAIKAEAA